MKNGVPFHVLFDVDELMPHERLAMYITMAELRGAKFDWDSMKFIEPKTR